MDEVSEILDERIRPLKVREYLQLAELGAFENEQVELLRGRVVRMVPQGEDHVWTVGSMNNLLVQAFGRWATVMPGGPLHATDDSMPEPDFMLVPHQPRPGPLARQALLIIEVAVSSLRLDRRVKASIYAATGSPEYWIVNVKESRLEVYRRPGEDGWAEHFTLGREDTLRPVSFPEVELRLGDFLLAQH